MDVTKYDLSIAIIGSVSSIHTIRWANTLSQKGFKVTIFSMHQSVDSISEDVEVVQLPFKNPYGYLLNIPFLRSSIKKLAPDLVHSFYAFGHSFLGRVCSGPIPHIVSVLGSDIFDDAYEHSLYKYIIKKNILSADAVCSTSLVMAEKIKEVCGDTDIHITPYGIDTALFSPGKNNGEQKTTFTIGTVKWLEYKYGIDILIRAFATFYEKCPNKDVELVIVGSGSREKEYRELSKELGVQEQCIFKGKIPHQTIPKQLLGFDIYVALSRLDSESFGVAILEASAMTLPVIVSDAGGLPEVVLHKKTGLVVKKEQVNQAAKAMLYLYTHPEVRKEMGKKGRLHVKKNYEWGESVSVMIQIYRSLKS